VKTLNGEEGEEEAKGGERNTSGTQLRPA